MPSLKGDSLNSEAKNIWKNLFPLIIFSMLIYTWFASLILRNANFSISLPLCDTVFYSDISKMIGITGQENTNGVSNILSESYNGLRPYHYFELWLNAAFSSVFKTIHLLSLFIFTYPVLNFITLLGFYSIIEKVTKVSFMYQAFALFFLFMGGLYFNNENPSADYALNLVESPIESYGEKFAVYYPFIICSFSFLMEGYFSIAIIILLILPLLSISTAPGLIAGLVLFSILAIIFKRIDRQSFLKIILYIFSL
ncbi:MAG: hypothetical protein ABI855_14015, partial [Bacteroidota bacterium]